MKAAIIAGYAPKNAGIIANALLDPNRYPLVVELVAKLSEEKRLRLQTDHEKLEQELGRIAYLDPADMYDEEGNLLPLRDMPEEVRKTIGKQKIVRREIRDDEGNVKVVTSLVDVEGCSKMAALSKLAEMKGYTHSKQTTINNLNVASADAAAAMVFDWGPLADKLPEVGDAVEARLAEARRLAEGGGAAGTMEQGAAEGGAASSSQEEGPPAGLNGHRNGDGA